MEEKFSHYLVPFEEVMVERLGTGAYEYHKRMGNIKGAPLAYMGGRTFKNAIVILDEAQNTAPEQMKMFLTSIGEGSRLIINGETGQVDVPRQVRSHRRHRACDVDSVHRPRAVRKEGCRAARRDPGDFGVIRTGSRVGKHRLREATLAAMNGHWVCLSADAGIPT